MVDEAEGDLEEQVDVDVSEEEDTSNMAPTPQQANMDPFLQKQEFTPNSSGLYFLTNQH